MARRLPPATRLAATALAAIGLACARPGPVVSDGARVVDLTHPFDAETVYWPTDERGFVLERGFEGETAAGHYYAAHRFQAAEHGGTHVDAPIHFHRDGRHVDEIPVERLVGPGVVVDVSAHCERDPDHLVSVADFAAFENAHGAIPDGAVVLIRTGFGERWPDRARYLGTDARGPAAVRDLRFPGLDPDAARWLVAQRRIRAVGLDTASIDRGRSTGFESHRVLSAHDVPAFENVAGLDGLPASGFSVVALPMKIRGGSGAPLRIIAIVPAGRGD